MSSPRWLFVVAGLSCGGLTSVACDSTDKGPSDPPPEPSAADWVLDPVTDNCPARPSARRFAQVAAFGTSRPPVLTGQDGLALPVPRGIALLGGIDEFTEGSDAPLRDLWIYDLHNRRDCPWIEVTSDAGLGRWAGAMVFDELRQALLVLGGEGEIPGGTASSSELWSLSLASLATRPVFVADEEILDAESVTLALENGAACELTEWFCIGATTDVVDFDACAGFPTLDFPADSHTGGPTGCAYANGAYDFSGCLVDPWCTEQATRLLETFRVTDRSHAAALVDPSAPVVTLWGGTTGARDTDGDPDTHVDLPLWAFQHLDEVADAPKLHAANLDGAVTVRLTPSGEAREVTSEESVPGVSPWIRPSDWPPDVTAGLRDAAAVPWGLELDRATLRPGSYEGELLLVGGTTHQQLWPVARHDLPATECPHPGGGTVPCEHPEPGPAVQGSGVPTWDESALAAGVLHVKADGPADNPAWSSGAGDAVATAAAAIEPRTLAVFGGSDVGHPTGSDRVVVVKQGVDEAIGVALRTEDADSDGEPDPIPPRFGAAAVADPVTGTAWMFGGSLSDERVYRLSSENSITPNVGSTWRMRDAEVELVRDGGVWHTTTAFRAVHSCERAVQEPREGSTLDPQAADQCFATELTLVFPAAGLTGALPSDVSVSALHATDGLGTSILAESVVLVVEDSLPALDDGELLATARVRLPVPVPAQGEVVLRVQRDFTVNPRNDMALPGLGGGFRGAFSTVTGGGEAHLFRGLPVLLPLDSARPVTRLLDEVARVSVTSALDATFGAGDVVACTEAGFQWLTPDAAGATCFRDPARYPGGLMAWAGADGVTLRGEAVGPHTTLRLWVDSSLDAALQAELTAAGPHLSDDLQWLVDHLGPWPGEPVEEVVFVSLPPAHSGVGVGAEALPGVVVISALDDEVWQLVALHELSHAWFGHATTFDPGARWLQEAAPSLFEAMRYPFHDEARFDLEDGLLQVVREDNDVVNLEAPARNAPTSLAYERGALALAQWHATRSAQGAGDSVIMAELVGLLAAPSGLDAQPREWAEGCGPPSLAPPFNGDERPTVTHDQLATLLNADTPAFHCEHLHPGQLGFPLVGLSRLDAGAPSVEVAQVQDRLLGWPLFTDVPYHLACDSVPEPGVLVYPACTVEGIGGWLGPAHRLGAAGHVASEVLDLGAPLQTAYVGIVAADQLLPELGGPFNPSSGLTRAATLLLRCAPGDTDPPCDADADLDGYPEPGDCDDAANWIHPDADMGDLLFPDSESVLVVDLNCDGWPTYRFPGAP